MNKESIRVELVSQFYRKNHCAFFTALIVSVLTGTTGLMVSWLIKEFIDLIAGQSAYTLPQLTLMSVAFIAFALILTVINYHCEPAFVRKAMRQYKEKAFFFLSSKNISSFRNEATSTYLSALTNDATTIEQNYVMSTLQIASKIISFTGSIILMFIYSPVLTGFSVAIVILPMLVSAVMGRMMSKIQREVSDRNAGFTAALTDCLGGFQVIKSFRAEGEVQNLFIDEDSKLEDSKCHLRKISGVAGALGMITGSVAQLGVFLMGSYLAISGKGITAGSVLMFVNLMNFMIDPVVNLPKLLAGRKAAAGLIDKLAGSLSRNTGSEGGSDITTVGDLISFKDVSFKYEGSDREVLHDINCEFLPGKSYAIVGASGSGKSTFLNLLMDGTSDYKGEIRIDGKELRTISPDSLYDLMTVIQQNVFIFNSSIRDNVTMFRDFSSGKIEDALRKAHLHELIEERGDDYLCGENGKGLSGGEKQRVSIARSLLKESPILLADEATSALDNMTSHEVINGILDLDSMTRIVVTHSLDESLLRRYDEIIVIKDGTIEEKGTYDALMNNNGYFKALYTVAA